MDAREKAATAAATLGIAAILVCALGLEIGSGGNIVAAAVRACGVFAAFALAAVVLLFRGTHGIYAWGVVLAAAFSHLLLFGFLTPARSNIKPLELLGTLPAFLAAVQVGAFVLVAVESGHARRTA